MGHYLDTLGTEEETFQISLDGALLKNEATDVLQIRNSDDSGFAR